MALVTAYGQPAGNAATGSSRTTSSVIVSHPYTNGGQRTVRLVKVSRPGSAALRAGQRPVRGHLLPRLTPPHRSGTPARGVEVPKVSSHTLTRRSSSEVLANFDGVDAIQNAATAFDLEPPDEGLGAGNGYVVNFVNVTGAIYNTHGGDGAGTVLPEHLLR